MNVLSLNSGDDTVDRNEVPGEPEILRWNSHRESDQLRQMEYGQVEGSLDGSSGPFLVDVQAHMAERTGRHHEVGAVIPRVLHIRASHGDRDGFLLQNNGESTALSSTRIGDRLSADRTDDLFQ